ncbi:hypothetical protein PAUR_a1623 [Pseudoalteromonas aurantia 208]|uniref:Uncharacterized protein n=1 Tax=Pseudoalteromonas aurantia 208 TaxID=1314867 RepID=A0ABR9EAT1_9GAMM|nr:hypothetical protein [Pseudoalteromonas aurantia 208]
MSAECLRDFTIYLSAFIHFIFNVLIIRLLAMLYLFHSFTTFITPRDAW